MIDLKNMTGEEIADFLEETLLFQMLAPEDIPQAKQDIIDALAKYIVKEQVSG